MKTLLPIVCFISIALLQVASSQCLNREHNLFFNRQIPETRIMEPTMIYSPPVLRDTPRPAQLREIPPLLNSPTTIISDCTPSVCKTLVDIIQLMSVCNLMKDKNGGSDVAIQMAEPFLKELISSPTLSKSILTKPTFSNFVNPNVISPFSLPAAPNLPPSIISPLNPIYTNLVSQNMVNPNTISSVYPNFYGSSNFVF